MSLFLFWQTAKKWTSNARWGTGENRQLGHYPQLPSTHKWKQLKQVERQKQHRLACFFLSHSKKKGLYVCRMRYLHCWWMPSWLMWVYVMLGGPKRDAVPLLRHCSLISLPVSHYISDLLFPILFPHFQEPFVSFLTINFVHSFTLSRPPLLPPLTLAVSLRSIFPLHPL